MLTNFRLDEGLEKMLVEPVFPKYISLKDLEGEGLITPVFLLFNVIYCPAAALGRIGKKK